MDLHPIDRLGQFDPPRRTCLEVLVVHGLEFKDMRLCAFPQPLNHTVQADPEVTAVGGEVDLPPRIGVTIPDSAAHIAQVLDQPGFLKVARLEQAANASLNRFGPSPPERIPDRPVAILAYLAAAQMWAIAVLSRLLIVIEDRRYRW